MTSFVLLNACAYVVLALLNLHRAYFAQALKEQPQDLLRHRYGPSVMATYRSAWRLIEGLKEACKFVAPVLGRTRLAWSQCLSAAVSLSIFILLFTLGIELRADRDVPSCHSSSDIVPVASVSI